MTTPLQPARPINLETLAAELDFLMPLIKVFEREVWFGQLAQQVAAAKERGQRGKVDEYEVLAWTCAGRTMITLHGPGGHWVSLMVATDQATSSMGLHSMSLDPQTAYLWIHRVLHHWQPLENTDEVGVGLPLETRA